MFKPTAYYLLAGAAIVGGPALGHDLMRRGRLASAEDLHHRENAAYRRALQDDIHTQRQRDEAEREGVDPDAVRRRLDQQRDGAGTGEVGGGGEASRL